MSLVFKCCQNVTALLSVFNDRGYWPNSILLALLGACLSIPRIRAELCMQASVGVLSPFSKSWFVKGPHISMPCNEKGSITD